MELYGAPPPSTFRLREDFLDVFLRVPFALREDFVLVLRVLPGAGIVSIYSWDLRGEEDRAVKPNSGNKERVRKNGYNGARLS